MALHSIRVSFATVAPRRYSSDPIGDVRRGGVGGTREGQGLMPARSAGVSSLYLNLVVASILLVFQIFDALSHSLHHIALQMHCISSDSSPCSIAITFCTTSYTHTAAYWCSGVNSHAHHLRLLWPSSSPPSYHLPPSLGVTPSVQT